MEAELVMDAALVAGRLVLALVLGVAGLAKLVDRAGSRQTLIDFGVPTRLAAPLGRLLPLAELVVAVALIARSTAWWGAAGALALLLLFIAGMGFNLARGRRPDCRCFGQFHSQPIGPATLARNGVLAAMAAFVVLAGREEPGPGLLGWLAGLGGPQAAVLVVGLVALALLAIEGWLLVHLLRQQGRLLLRIEALEAGRGGAPLPASNGAAASAGLPVGATAPPFALPDLEGREVALDDLRAADKPVLLLFTDPHCGPCGALLPEIGRWWAEHAARLTLAVLSRGSPEENRARASEHGIGPILLQRDYEVADAYQAYGTPSAVLVRPDGTIGSPVAAGAEAIRALVAHAAGPAGARPWAGRPEIPVLNGHGHGHAHPPARPAGAPVGAPAPPIRLPDPDGRTVELADFRGQSTLVLFWNPGCGFCQQMLPDLQAWEEQPPEGAPRLLVVSGGDAEAVRSMGLRSPVVLDAGFSAGRAFGADGTPMAVLVDTEGKVASALAAGAPAVLALLGARSDRTEPATA